MVWSGLGWFGVFWGGLGCFHGPDNPPTLCYVMVMLGQIKDALKRVSFGSKDCTKELKLECAYFLGQTS